MKTSESIATIAPALVAALAKIEGAAKSAKNDHFKSRYATLEAVIEASKDVLAEHKLCLLQFPGALTNGALGLETVLLHESGEWVSGDFQIALGKLDPQGVGSALTYARRYAQMAALNIPAVDDDAESAMPRQAANAPQPQAPAKPKQTLKERADAFAASIRAAATEAALERVWKLGEGLRNDLDRGEPELLVEVSEAYSAQLNNIEIRTKEAA